MLRGLSGPHDDTTHSTQVPTGGTSQYAATSLDTAAPAFPSKEKLNLGSSPEYLNYVPKKHIVTETKSEKPALQHTSRTPIARSDSFASPQTRPYSRVQSKKNKYTLTSPSLKIEKFESVYSPDYQPVSPGSDISRMGDRHLDAFQLSLQLMETYRPTLDKLFEDLLNLNATEPYFLTRLFSLLPYFSNHFTRQQLLLHLEGLIQENQETLTSSANVLETKSVGSPDLQRDYLSGTAEEEDSTKKAIAILIEGILEGNESVTEEHITLIVTIMCKVMSKRFTQVSSQQEFSDSIQNHLHLYQNAKKSPEVIDSIANTLYELCTEFIVDSKLRPSAETIDNHSTEAEMRLAEVMQLDRDLEEMRNSQHRLSEKLQKFEEERKAFLSAYNDIESIEPNLSSSHQEEE